MKVRIFDTDARVGEETYVELTQEQYDKYKAIFEETGYLSKHPNATEFQKEIFAVPVSPPEIPELVWYW